MNLNGIGMLMEFPRVAKNTRLLLKKLELN